MATFEYEYEMAEIRKEYEEWLNDEEAQRGYEEWLNEYYPCDEAYYEEMDAWLKEIHGEVC